MRECRFIITDHISWWIGDGKSAKFWEDSWDGHESISKIVGNKEWIIEAKSKYGELVVDYVKKDAQEVGKYEWKAIQLESIDNDDLRTLMGILECRRITLRDRSDEIIWCATKSGEYSIKLGYQI
jgi:hypothetical protein